MSRWDNRTDRKELHIKNSCEKMIILEDKDFSSD
jgi:hypothetical protein